MFSLINYLENLNYVVRVQVDVRTHEVTGLFFLNEKAIGETRLWPETLTVDATYKANAHRMSLVNIVGTSNVSSIKGGDALQTFAVAAAFINSEVEANYTWIMHELKQAVWPTDENFVLPSVFVTYNEKALRNAIESVFPERSHHLLCSWHLWNTMATKLPIRSGVGSEEYNYRCLMAEEQFKKAMCSHSEASFKDAITKLRNRYNSRVI